jgi:hypothetical protein
MNQKIVRLAEQCGWDDGHDHLDIEKFANLIIRECVSVCSTDRVGKTISIEELIAEHFKYGK